MIPALPVARRYSVRLWYRPCTVKVKALYALRAAGCARRELSMKMGGL